MPVPTPGPGQVLLRTIWLSLDPYMRGRMSDLPSYVPPYALNEVLGGGTVSEVIASDQPAFQRGDIVVGMTGWETHALSNGKDLRKLDPATAPPSTALGVLGMPGMTAYAGLLEIGKPQPGETVVVAAASGAVGSAVGQIARIKGARAVGIAGGSEKCRYVTDVLGFDACVDHRSPTFRDDLKAACPTGIDVYFENVGGAVLEAVLPLLNPFARIPLCGFVAQYNDTEQTGRPMSYLMRLALTRRLTIRGFLVFDFAASTRQFLSDMTGWFNEGQIKHRESIVEGLANAPGAFIGMLRGANFGKQLVRIGPDKV
jgi:NADPH-dependent curcumin reductase CurA